jgi:hypothetical protein
LVRNHGSKPRHWVPACAGMTTDIAWAGMHDTRLAALLAAWHASATWGGPTQLMNPSSPRRRGPSAFRFQTGLSTSSPQFIRNEAHRVYSSGWSGASH